MTEAAETNESISDAASRADGTDPAALTDSPFAAPPEPLPPRETLTAAGELLRALAAPVRISIVLQLRNSERCVHELVGILGITQPLVSQHLRVLKTAGVVRGERVGREVLYRLVDDHLVHIVVDAVAHASESHVSESQASNGTAPESTAPEDTGSGPTGSGPAGSRFGGDA